MDRLEEQLLDYEAPKGPSFKDDKLVIGARYGIAGFIVVSSAKTLLFVLTGEIDYQSGPIWAFVLGLIIPISLNLLFAFYNVVQANMEKSADKIYPVFRKPFIVLCMAGCFLTILFNFFRIISSPILSALIIALCVTILRRESQYFKMVS